MTLETITGNLRDAYKQLQPGTMLHVDQLMNERRLNPLTETGEDLREQGFYTADGEIYFLDGRNKTPTLAITRETHNPVLQHIDDASEQLVNNHNYLVSQSAVEQALAAPDREIIVLPNLRLSGDGAEWRYLEISTSPSKYAKLNDTERRFAERVFGQGDDFPANMEMLKKAKISETKIYVLNPDYVRKHASESAVARASWLGNFGDNSSFSADDRSINNHNRVRGVRRNANEVSKEAPAGRRHAKHPLRK